MVKGLTLVFAIALLACIVLAYWLNRVAVDLAVSEAFYALFAGLKILFFTLLILGSAWVLIELKRHSQVKVIRPGKHGPVQAIVQNGQVVQLAAPGQQQLDPMQQLALLKAAMQIQGQMAKFQVQEVGAAAAAKPLEIEGPSSQLPTNVNYLDIKSQVPKGHILVGIGRKGIETKERAVGACLWIVGLSGTGKTSTTVLRVEERAAAGHKFMGVDPHWFKPDSLTNAVTSYRSRFIMPMAQTPEETNKVLRAFLAEFQARKAGKVAQPWQPITLLVDEVGSLMDPTTPEEEENKELLPSIARICGQEARNFEMGGIFISQQATGLAWLRKVALMVIVHQLLQESEKRLATNNDTAVMAEMKLWPIGRTYVFGVGFQEGPRTVQQPRFEAPTTVEGSIERSPETEETPSVNSAVNDAVQPGGKVLDDGFPFDPLKLKKIAKMLREKRNQQDIVSEVWGVPTSGRAFNTALQEYREMLAYLSSMIAEND